jgi:hypothetical protein
MTHGQYTLLCIAITVGTIALGILCAYIYRRILQRRYEKTIDLLERASAVKEEIKSPTDRLADGSRFIAAHLQKEGKPKCLFCPALEFCNQNNKGYKKPCIDFCTKEVKKWIKEPNK